MINLKLTKEEFDILNSIINERRNDLSSLNFEASKLEVKELRELAPLHYKIKQICKDQ